MHTKPSKKRKDERGFILIMAMLIMSIILAISFSIYTISIKEVVLGAYMRESEKAFMAADRAMECALFWDRATPPRGGLQYTPFPTSTAWTSASINVNTPNCHNGTAAIQLNAIGATACGAAWTVSGLASTTGITNYHISFSDGTCAQVEVFKSGINTTITADGYNTTNTGNNRRTERTIVARYNL